MPAASPATTQRSVPNMPNSARPRPFAPECQAYTHLALATRDDKGHQAVDARRRALLDVEATPAGK